MTNQRFINNNIDGGLIIAVLLTLFAVQALLQPGLPASADLAIHLHRTMEFERAWAPGVIVPRWAPNLAYGYGYPLFIFAPPFPYILGVGFQWLGFNLGFAFKALIILTLLLYTTGMYLFVRDLFISSAAGLIAATAYAFAPFALREALLEGGNVPQLLAIGLFPWPLWAVTRAIRYQSWGWTVLASIFYAAIILSHLFHALVFSLVLGLYIGLLLIAVKKQPVSYGMKRTEVDRYLLAKTSTIWLGLLTPVIGLLLSAFFWLPAFIERLYTRAQVDIYLEKSPFFVRYPHWSELIAWIQPLDVRAANPYIPLSLGVITLILAGLGLLTGILKSWKRDSFNLQSFGISTLLDMHFAQDKPSMSQSGIIFIIFFAMISVTATFLTLPVSQPVWEVVTILQVAEFPWRMMGVANLGLAVMAGAAILSVPPKIQLPITAGCIVIQLWAIGPYLYPIIPFTQYNQLTIADQINYERSSQSIGTTTLGEYLPHTVARPPTTSPLVKTFQAGSFPERLDRINLPQEVIATLLEQTAVIYRYQLNSPTAFTLRLLQFDFPGWQAQLDGQSVSIIAENETGFILVDIPAGQHTLTIRFGETPIRVAALSLTGLTIIGLVVITCKRRGVANLVPTLSVGTRLESLPVILMATGAIVLAALWLKPLMRPLFTVDSPREHIIPAQYQTDIRFADGIQLAGYTLNQHKIQAGGYLSVILYWQTEAAPHRVNLQPFVHLDRLNDFTTIADSTNYTPGDVTTETNLPTFHWDNSRYVRDDHDLTIPFNASPVAYAVRVGLINPDQGGQLIPLANDNDDTALIDIINVLPVDNRSIILAQLPDVIFTNQQDAIRLTGFEISTLTATQLEFKLAWQSEQKPINNYTVFAQLLDSDKNLVTSFDRPPLDGAYPTSTWLPDQSILDARFLPLEGVAQGNYTLIIGLYDPNTGQRLITANGLDYTELSTITIQ